MPTVSRRSKEKALPERLPGPVTAALRLVSARQRPPFRAALLLWPAIPALFLIRAAMHRKLGVYADGVLGFDAALCLIACLTVTPFITVTRMKITDLRRWYGIWVFVLGAAGVAVHLLATPGGIAQRVAGNATDWSGTLIVVLLFPMTATSATVAQKLLGPEWKRWQRNLMWSVCFLVAGHFVLLHAWLVLAAYSGCTLPAILLRNQGVRKSIKTWRTGGYSTGGWWTGLAIIGALVLAGLIILITEEVSVIAHAASLT